MTNKDLTIIITTFKSEDKIESCLDSIDPSIKVIVIENSNNKKFQNFIENKYLNTECILANENLGYGKANNIGLKKAKTKYCLVLNPDTILEKDAIRNFYFSVEKNKNFYIIAPLQVKDEFSKNNNFTNGSTFLEAKHVEGFAMFLNMEKFSDIGFFDENFFLYLEEIDLCKRVKDKNGVILVNNNIKIFHFAGKSVKNTFSYQVELTRNWHWMWSLFYYNKKHSNYFYALILVSPKFISALFKVFIYRLIFKKKKSEIYSKRLSGLYSAIIGKPSWYRPALD
jgi:N-acetylglucosaminyl-diphospho-decaprenol L-rhamnosyltransferase|tara:strand:- start:48 stop:896 length:849 start_codon:yes stop_codon:yes gene_type:complete